MIPMTPSSRSGPLAALLPAAALLLLLAPCSLSETWTDKRGRKMEAELLSVKESKAVFKLASGKEVTVAVDLFSEEDQKRIKDWEPAESDEEGAGRGEEKDPDDAGAARLNFDAPWPKKVSFNGDAEINTVEEDKEKGRFIYESANYRFICDVRLSQSVVKGFAVMFEATQLYCRELPLAISGGIKEDGKYPILLFENKEDYIKAGGPPSSAGVFIGGKGVVMVPLTSLGVRPVGSGYMLDRDKASGTLIHELTHQLTPEVYFAEGALGWFSEGIAEYVTATPYRAGNFKVGSNFDDIRAYATGYGKDDTRGRALGESIQVPALRDFFLMSYREFAGPNANFNYGMGLMLTTYFLHLDGDGDAARIKAFLRALRAGKSGEDALEVLRDGRSYEELEEAIAKAWKRKGVEIEFAEAGSGGSAD
jgi:hypothetical protein